jgi:hypothetical protein
VLDEFPGNPGMSEGHKAKIFPALTEELDKHAFLYGIKINCNGCSLVQVSWVNPNFLGITRRVESLDWQGSAHVG